MESCIFPLRVELPRGHHAILRDPEEVPERLRRPLLDKAERSSVALVEAGVTEAEVLAANGRVDAAVLPVGMKLIKGGVRALNREVNDLLIVALVESWSFDFPVGPATVQDLPGPAFDELVEACTPLAKALNPDFTASPDPDSPTKPSSD